MLCQKCQRDLPSDAVVCCYCGKKIQSATNGKKSSKRPNGTGNVYKRKDTWTARVVDHYKNIEKDGKKILRPIWKTKGGFKTKRDALNYLPTLYQSTPNARKEKCPTLIEYWESYKTNELPKLSVSKQVAYKGAWKKLEKIAWFRVDTITVNLLRETVSETADTYYKARDCKVLLSHLFKLAGADGWVSKDLPSYIVLPDLHEKERQVFTAEEQKALWKNYDNGDIDAAIPLVMIYTGMMPGELFGLKVEHIDFENHQIVGAGMKTAVRKKSPVVLSDAIEPVIEDLVNNAHSSGYLFKRSEKEWYERYYASLERAGCRRLEPYCCRHTTATALAITEGIAPQTVQKMMRWSSTKMLDRYAHPDTSDILKAANKFTKSTG